MGRMQDKTAVITGGTSGIGRAAAELFVAEGARVLIVGRDEAQLQALQDALGADRLLTFAADLRDGRQVAAYTRLALERFGRIDAVLLNAGVAGMNTPLEDYPEDLFDEVLAINLKAVWLGLRAVVPAMKAQGGGSIVADLLDSGPIRRGGDDRLHRQQARPGRHDERRGGGTRTLQDPRQHSSSRLCRRPDDGRDRPRSESGGAGSLPCCNMADHSDAPLWPSPGSRPVDAVPGVRRVQLLDRRLLHSGWGDTRNSALRQVAATGRVARRNRQLALGGSPSAGSEGL